VRAGDRDPERNLPLSSCVRHSENEFPENSRPAFPALNLRTITAVPRENFSKKSELREAKRLLREADHPRNLSKCRLLHVSAQPVHLSVGDFVLEDRDCPITDCGSADRAEYDCKVLIPRRRGNCGRISKLSRP